MSPFIHYVNTLTYYDKFKPCIWKQNKTVIPRISRIMASNLKKNIF